MDDAVWKQVKWLFHDALELPEHQRPELLAAFPGEVRN